MRLGTGFAFVAAPEYDLVPLDRPAPISPAPGDIIVTPVYSGFMLGRAIPNVGLGPWWTFITTVSEYDAAVEQARTIALAEGVRVWLQKRGDEYVPL